LKRKANNLLRADVILTLAGFDGTGGAGVSTDIKICSYLKIQNVSVIGSLVIQSPVEVEKKIDLEPEVVKDQISILGKFYNVKIVNIGLFGDLRVLNFVVRHFSRQKIVFDPIFSSGSGKFKFLKNTEITRIKKYLKNFYLITPNIPEAEILSDLKIKSLEDVKQSARKLRSLGAQNILIKGGHLKGNRKIDTLLSDDNFYTFDSFSTGYNIHGTGGFLNAAICAYIFKGESLVTSIKNAKKLLQKVIKKTDKFNPILNI
jgi:hydroxymethylpyrimidine/phosphomethylpyrimidine kinase